MNKLILLLLLYCFTNLIYGQYDFTTLVTNVSPIYTNEPSAASNGNFVAVGCNYNNGPTINTVGFFYSNDNGVSWTQGIIPKGFGGNSDDDSDPSLAFDAAGNLYYVYLSALSNGTSSGIFINKSTNNGQSWLSYQVVSIASSNGWVDKPYIYIKNYSGTSSKIFITYKTKNITAGNYEIKLAFINTEDMGELGFSFSTIRSVSTSHDLNSPIPHCTADGKLFVTFIEKEYITSGVYKFLIKVSRSDNDGLNFYNPVTIREYLNNYHIGFYLAGSYYYGEDGHFFKKFRVNGFPTITSINNKLYIAWSEKVDMKDQILIYSSSNYGTNWNAESMTPFSFNHQFFPWLSRTIDNKLCLVYHSCYDIPLVNDPLIYTCLYIFNPGNGTSEEALVDEFNFRESFTTPGTNAFIGDYINIGTYSNDKINFVFTSNATDGSPKPTVIKCASIPNKVNIELQSYQNSNFATNPVAVSIDGNPYIEPAGGNKLQYTNSYTFQNINFMAQEELGNFNYRHRNINNIGNPFTTNYEFSSSPFALDLRYYSVLPLTVSSYFEGAQNIGNYDLTWTTGTNTSVTNSYSTTPYRTFDHDLTLDRYDIRARSLAGTYDNTNWSFSHWNDGSIDSLKTNIEVTSPGASFTAYYKGRMRTNHASAFSPSSKNLIKYGSRYILIYESMDKIWFTNSLNSFNGEWEEETDLLLINNLPGKAKNLYVDVYDGIVRVVFEYFPPQSSEAQIICAELEGPFEVIDTYPESFFGSAHPILSYSGTGNGYEELFIYKKSQSSGYYYKRYHYNGGQWYWASNQISTTSSASNNLTAVPDKNSTDNSIHLSWEENGDITYSLSYAAGGYRYFPASVISKNSGYPNNYKPSISLTGDGDVVVSWTANTEAFLSKLSDETETVYKTIVRAKHKDVWGSFFITGDNVENTYNSSSLSTANETVIAWNENNNSSTKYTRRFNGNYCDVQTLNQSGSAPVLSNGAALSDIKAAVLNNAALPYKILKATNDFSSLCDFGGERTEKISSGIGMLYGRSGNINKNGVEFIFNIFDVITGDSSVNFISRSDTLSCSTLNELNKVLRTETVELNSLSTLYFSNHYYVLNSNNADTVLTDNDEVVFKVQLINASTGQSSGQFDYVKFNKNNLSEYGNSSYAVTCSGVEPGDYYLQLKIEVEGDAEYNLAMHLNDVSSLAKKNHNEIYFDGSGIPAHYDLSQNYPNPFNPSTTIRYQIPQDGMVTLKVYDVLGQEVKTLVNEVKTKGRYEVTFNAGSLASGLYIYEINSGSFKASKKMTMIK